MKLDTGRSPSSASSRSPSAHRLSGAYVGRESSSCSTEICERIPVAVAASSSETVSFDAMEKELRQQMVSDLPEPPPNVHPRRQASRIEYVNSTRFKQEATPWLNPLIWQSITRL